MDTTSLLRRAVLTLTLSLALTSCGGGGDTAGAGGSGIGGTGITTVAGNISQVLARAARPMDRTVTGKMIAIVSRLVARSADAQSGSLAGIRVIGGGQEATTGNNGSFDLEDVTPSSHFVLTFVPQGAQSISLAIGAVAAGSHVRVVNVVLNTSQGQASAEGVEVEDSSAGGQGSPGSSEQSSSGGSGSDSVDNSTTDSSQSLDSAGGGDTQGGSSGTSSSTSTESQDGGASGSSSDSGD